MADLAGIHGTRKEFRVVGKPNLPGVLSWSQATGVAKFGVDYVVHGMLHARFLRSSYANARIKKLGTAKAKAATRSASGSNRRRRPTGFSKPSAKHQAVARFPLKIGVVGGKRATRYGKPIGVIPRKKDTDILLSQKPGLGL